MFIVLEFSFQEILASISSVVTRVLIFSCRQNAQNASKSFFVSQEGLVEEGKETEYRIFCKHYQQKFINYYSTGVYF